MALRLLVLCGILGLSSQVGCGLQRPFQVRPGTVEEQRFSASVYDPYSDNDAGPEVVGGRPRDFSKPRAEPTRSRAWNEWVSSAKGWLSGQPATAPAE